MDSPIRASCLCGDVAWEGRGPLELVSHCHCSICRKTHGSAFATWGAVPAGTFRWLTGRNAISRYESTPGFFRRFCARCGSPVAGADGEQIFMPLGCVDGDPEARPLAHIFAGSRAAWHAIHDDLPQFEDAPPGYPVPEGTPPVRPASEPGRVRGSCQCDGVAWEVAGGLPLLRNCHCTRCRKARGAAFASNAFCPVDALRWLRGEDLLASYKVPDAERFSQAFCTRCGSAMPVLQPQRGFAVIPAGSIDGDPAVREREHIFVASKAPWYEIGDDLPQHPEYPPES